MLIHHLFEHAASVNRSTIALVMDDQECTYGELDQLSNQVARKLISQGVVSGDIVGISLRRSIDLIAGIIGILKAGAAYLPLDTEYPLERIQYMITHSKVKNILIDEEFSSSLLSSEMNQIFFDKKFFFDISNEKVSVDKDQIDLCYVIYTSGSSGRPKGVSLGHQALSNLLLWQNQSSSQAKPLTTLQYTPVSFDVHFQEIFSTLTSGGKLILISEHTRVDPIKLLKLIQDNQVQRLFLPYVALNQLTKTAQIKNIYPSSLKEVITAGEQLIITPSIRNFFQTLDRCLLFNHYGPSETHVVTSYCLEHDPSLWPDLPSIGRAISHVDVLLLDSQMNPVIDGEEGEIYLGGICLAKGYLNSPEMTKERFLNHPRYGRVFKTGDSAIRDQSGNFRFLGRKDGQVKIRGHRVEIAEIELALQKYESIGQSAAKVIEVENEKVICAYYTGLVELNSLKEFVKSLIPHYMLPSYFIKLDKIDLTPSGKINYQLLPRPSKTRPRLMQEFVLPQTDTEMKLEKMWKKFLFLDEIGIHDSFFDLGGTSLLAMNLLVEVSNEFNKELNIVHFFQNPTLFKLAKFIEGEISSEIEERIELNQNHDEIVVIGMAAKFPGVNSIDELWENLLNEKSLIEKFDGHEIDPSIPRGVSQDKNYVFACGHYPDRDKFDYKFFGMTPRESELMDPQQRKFLELAVEALESAGHYHDQHSEVIGIYSGMGNSKYQDLVNQETEKINKVGEFNVMLGLEKDYIATRVAYKLNLTGPAISIHTGCSTSLVAIIEAVKALRLGECTMALAGGISISGMSKSGHLFQEGGILSQDGKCRPFEQRASGTVFTEGGGIVVLRKLSDALKDGDHIWGVIKGVGLNNDGAGKMSFTAPSLIGQTKAIRRAQLDAKIDPSTMTYLEAHGTGTPVGDPIELEALRQAFELSTQKKNFCHLGSIKANVGHLTSAAGVAGFIKAILVLNKGIVPAMPEFKSVNQMLNLQATPFKISPNHCKLEKKSNPWRAGVSSFGVGGTNAHVIVEEFVKNEIEEHLQVSEGEFSRPLLFKISAKSNDVALEMEKDLIQFLSKLDVSLWPKVAYTLEVGRKNYSYRKFLVLGKKEDLNTIKSSSSTLATSSHKRTLYFMFPGQGSQYSLMSKSLYETNLIFKNELDKCSQVLKKIAGYSIKDILYKEENAQKLDETYYTQPALFVVEYALAQTFMLMGYRPSVLIGHSLGEYVAATISGIFSLEDALKIVVKRAEFMMIIEQGSMISVPLNIEELEKHLKSRCLSVAAVNGPQSSVVSGERVEVEKFQKYLTQQNIASVILNTSHAFHSEMMRPMVAEFKKFIDSIKLNSPKIPIFSTVTVKIDDHKMTEALYWAEHICQTVHFASVIDHVLKDNNPLIMEVGPKNVLCSLVNKQARLRDHKNMRAISSLWSPKVDEQKAFLNCVGELWCENFKMKNPELLFYKHERVRFPSPVYQFEKLHAWPTNNDKYKVSNQEKFNMDSKKKQFVNRLIKIFEDASGLELNENQSDQTFLELGMDSLLLTQVAIHLNRELEIPVTFRQLLEDYPSLTSLSEAFGNSDECQISPNHNLKENNLGRKEKIKDSDVVDKNVCSIESPNSVERIFQQQIELMNEQISLLKNLTIKDSVIDRLESLQSIQNMKLNKESFGAAAKINVERSVKLDDQQNQMLQEFYLLYVSKTKKSKEFAQRNRKMHADPRVVTGFRPENKEITYPIVIHKSSQQYFWDLDGNKYVDMICGFGSNFFGNGNEKIKKNILNQLEQGFELGPQHPLVEEVGQLICDLTGNDRVAFCNTGSEAVLGAMRLARTITRREKIIVFSGSYHGINDEVIIRGHKNKSYPAAPGINHQSVSNIIVLDYGTDQSLEVIREISHEVAAILVEPVQSRRCDFHPSEFLSELRKITLATKTCLIFDEVITGFRIHPAGAQGHFNIRADLCTYGKIIGGGMPIGVISGKAEYMDALDGGHWSFGDDSVPSVGVTYFAGTFVRHPLALAAAKGALEVIKDGGEKQLFELNKKAQTFADKINRFCDEHRIPFRMNHFGSLMRPKWTTDVAAGEVFYAILRFNGVHVIDGFPWFLNLAHSDDDILFVFNAIKNSFKKMQKMGLLVGSLQIEFDKKADFCQDILSTNEAKLGRDEKGNPAWFIENPERSGEYYQLEG